MRKLPPIIFTFLICILILGQQCKSSNKSENKYDSLRVVLEDIYDNDQNLRQIISDSLDSDSPEMSKYISMMIDSDAANLKVISKILENHGWIPQDLIGEKASDALFYVIQHSDLITMEKYYPQLDSLSLTGKAKKQHSAMMKDRILMYKGLKQIYGTQATSTLRPDNKMVIWPIANPEKVDSLRKIAEIELTVFENAKRLGAEYKPDEKLPKN